jgi:transcriptional regulator with XRE-family HTH domain
MKQAPPNSWHTRLTTARRAKNFTKVALAALIGVTPPAITGWENGQTKKIEGENLMAVCRILEITPDWLMNGGDYIDGMVQSPVEGDARSGIGAEVGSNQSEMCNPMMLTEEETRLFFSLRKLKTSQKVVINLLITSFLQDGD